MNLEHLQISHSGCSKPARNANSFRFRLLRALGKQGNPAHCRVCYRTTGLFPKALTSLGVFLFLNRRCMPFVCDTKTKARHRWPEKPDDPAGLEQPVGGRGKDMPAGGYSAATWWKTTVRQVLFLTETREVLLAVSSRLVVGGLCLALLSGCSPSAVVDAELKQQGTNPYVDIDHIRVQIVKVDGKLFAVAMCEGHVSICEVTSHGMSAP